MPWLPFVWSSDTIFGREIERAAIFLKGEVLPLGVEGAFQFDLGAPRSVIYGGAFKSNSLKRYVTDKMGVLNGRKVPILNLKISVGEVEVKNPLLLEDFGSGEAEGLPIVGTVGADLIAGRVLLLDFPAQRMAVVDALPGEFEGKVRFSKMEIKGGKLLVQVELDGKTDLVMYDSGSSTFGLLTSRKIWENLTDGEVVDSFKIAAWGKVYTVYGGRSRLSITLGGVPLKVDTIHYVDMPGLDDFLKRVGVVGIIGNRPIWDRVVVIDTKGKRFGIYVGDRK